MAARLVERALQHVREARNERWVKALEPMPDRLRDGDPAELARLAARARSFYGANDSIAEVLPWELALELRDALDALRRELARRSAHLNRG